MKNLFEEQFRKVINDDSEYSKKVERFNDKKSDLIIKQREKMRIMKRKHSQQLSTLRMKQNMEIKMLNKKHSDNLTSLYGRTMN